MSHSSPVPTVNLHLHAEQKCINRNNAFVYMYMDFRVNSTWLTAGWMRAYDCRSWSFCVEGGAYLNHHSLEKLDLYLAVSCTLVLKLLTPMHLQRCSSTSFCKGYTTSLCLDMLHILLPCK